MDIIVGNHVRLSVNPKGEPAKASVKNGKKPYDNPTLAFYGNVSALTRNGSGSVLDGTGMSMVVMGSDLAIKENIVRIGTHPLDIGLYLFDYKPEYRDQWGHGRQFGVMAQDVETIMPDAVSVHEDGYKVVNYSMLGITRAVH